MELTEAIEKKKLHMPPIIYFMFSGKSDVPSGIFQKRHVSRSPNLEELLRTSWNHEIRKNNIYFLFHAWKRIILAEKLKFSNNWHSTSDNCVCPSIRKLSVLMPYCIIQPQIRLCSHDFNFSTPIGWRVKVAYWL